MNKRIRNTLVGASSAGAMVAGVAGFTSEASASTGTNDVFTATVTGTSLHNPTNGTLYIYDNKTSEHHTRSVDYYMNDKYEKTAVLTDSSHPLGEVLISETISNACTSNPNDASVNPVGGYPNTPCGSALHSIQPPPYKLGGDLLGRFTRKAQPGVPFGAPVHVTEVATGSGRYLTTGSKDHGGMREIDYYVNVTGVSSEVDVSIPKVAATDYNGVQRIAYPEITRIVLVSTTGTPHAVLVLNNF